MSILKSIKKRTSVRTYTNKVIDDQTILKIENYIKSLEASSIGKCRIEIIHTTSDGKPIKLGTYGFIKGAKTFLALVVDKNKIGEEDAAYLFEQVLLYCTSLGLGTCWLGVSFSKSAFNKEIVLNENEMLRIVSPIGYPSEKSHLSLFIFFGKKKARKRKAFGENFFDQTFDKSLSVEKAAEFTQPLEMVRLAPSANNKQSWKIIMEDKMFHFYKSDAYGFDAIDIGIAMCHFEQSCFELGIMGRFEIVANTPTSEKATYVKSWVAN